MENASKAVIMAGGILIGVIVLTIGVYIFTSFSARSQDIKTQIDSRALAEFNNNFTKYVGSENCTIHDIVSMASFAKKNNETFNNTNDPYNIKVFLDGYKGMTGYRGPKDSKGNADLSYVTEKEYMELLNKNSIKVEANTGSIQYYTCVKIEYHDLEIGKRVKSITFRKN